MFCGKYAKGSSLESDADKYRYDCPNCGTYVATWKVRFAFSDEPDTADKKKSRVAAVLRERLIHRGNIPPFLLIFPSRESIKLDDNYTSVSLPELVEDRFPRTVSDVLDRSLMNLARLSTRYGFRILLGIDDPPVLFCSNVSEMKYIADELKARQVINHCGYTDKGDMILEVSAEGWDRVAQLENQGKLAECKQAFIAMNFNDEFRHIYENGIKAAISETGYTPMRIDDKEHNEFIPDEIIAEIRRSRFLVADMTGQKHGVYFEAGFALGLGIPVIWTCRKDEIDQCHFDTKQINHIFWETPEELKEKLVNRIRATIV